MKARRAFLFKVGTALAIACAPACGQTNAGAITFRFEKDATLTPDQIQSVLRLASDCGISEASEIGIGHTLPLNRRFVFVTSKEKVSGRRTSYDEVHVYYSAWAGTLPKDAKAKHVGDFWINPPSIVTLELAEIQVAGKPIRVQMAHDTSTDTAETILNAFARGQVHSEGSGDEAMLAMAASSNPVTLSYSKELKQFFVHFENGLEARVKLNGQRVELTGRPTIPVY